jgi:hypothetical protein
VTPVPVPIGYAPAAGTPAACVSGPLEGRYRAHVEFFANRRVVVLPPGIGVALPRRIEGSRLVAGTCRASVRTLDPTGTLEFDRRGLRLADLFTAWRRRLGPRRLLGFRGPVLAFVGGRRVAGDPRRIRLRPGAEIVVEIGGYVPPHRSFVFPPRLSSGRRG